MFIVDNAVDAKHYELGIRTFSGVGDIVEGYAGSKIDTVEAALCHEDAADECSELVKTPVGCTRYNGHSTWS